MSKGLEALEEIKDEFFIKDGNSTIGDFGLYRRLSIIEKELKTLEIIKEKKVDLTNFLFIYEHEPQYGLRTYNDFINKYRGEKELTQEEYDLLKEVLL